MESAGLKTIKFATLTLGLVLLTGCYRKLVVESDCFAPFSVKATEYLNAESPQIWYAIGGNNGDDELLDLQIRGVIVEYDFAQRMSPLPPESILKFTGNIYKIRPSWAEANIGSGSRHILIEVNMNGEKYLVFDEKPRNSHLPELAPRCLWDPE
ncbi:MAG: hypothetical protein CL583_18885 [Alteromonadaceae bacterium]|nr:hypothetical protein [Alteromonadaceae bacterium]|tara:strand:- start:82 stop:543 length:462 start_codon:yes stop_codon:yes gene_type:complete